MQQKNFALARLAGDHYSCRMPMIVHAEHDESPSGGHEASGARKASSITYRVDRAQRLVYVVVSGAVTLDRLYAARDAVLGDSEYVPGFDIFVECRVLTDIPSNDEIRELALSGVLRRGPAKHGRVAIVATTERAFGAVSLLELYIDAPPDRVAVFTNPVQARAWLELGSDGT